MIEDTKVINQHGANIDFHRASKMMNPGIAADMEHGDGLTNQEFFDAYCIRHFLRFGKEFQPNTET